MKILFKQRDERKSEEACSKQEKYVEMLLLFFLSPKWEFSVWIVYRRLRPPGRAAPELFLYAHPNSLLTYLNKCWPIAKKECVRAVETNRRDK